MKHLLVAILFATACGGNDGSSPGDGGATGDAPTGDGGCTGLCTDAPPFGGECDPQGPQCSNCVDDDGDGATDGFDIHCSGPLDSDESSFGTGIPGDNIDEVKQDCFFDGNSGGGNDGCDIHVCCILGAPDRASWPPASAARRPPRAETTSAAARPASSARVRRMPTCPPPETVTTRARAV